ncbi:MAG: hypothetical protein ACRD3D_09460, partial [Terriglobia bacterium]
MQRELSALCGQKKVVLRQTPRAVTPFGGLSVLVEFLHRIGYRQQVSERRDFLEVAEDRYPLRSTILTSQVPVAR